MIVNDYCAIDVALVAALIAAAPIPLDNVAVVVAVVVAVIVVMVSIRVTHHKQQLIEFCCDCCSTIINDFCASTNCHIVEKITTTRCLKNYCCSLFAIARGHC